MGDIVPTLYDGDFLDGDLEAVRADPATAPEADLLVAFLDQVAGSTSALWKLMKWKDEHEKSPFFNCRAIECFQREGYNLYRLRPLRGRLQRYRILYAFEPHRNEYHLLAVVLKLPKPPPAAIDPRHYNYEHDHPISERVRHEYDSRGFTRVG